MAPPVFIDDNVQASVFWGNSMLHYARLKENMIELAANIKTITLPFYTEVPWAAMLKGSLGV